MHSSVARQVTLLMLLITAACDLPRTVRIDVPTTERGHVTCRTTRGSAEPGMRPCDTPCSVEVHRNTAYECTIQAPGYYPATFEFTYDMVFFEDLLESARGGAVIGGGKGASLLIPLQKVKGAVPGSTVP